MPSGEQRPAVHELTGTAKRPGRLGAVTGLHDVRTSSHVRDENARTGRTRIAAVSPQFALRPCQGRRSLGTRRQRDSGGGARDESRAGASTQRYPVRTPPRRRWDDRRPSTLSTVTGMSGVACCGPGRPGAVPPRPRSGDAHDASQRAEQRRPCRRPGAPVQPARRIHPVQRRRDHATSGNCDPFVLEVSPPLRMAARYVPARRRGQSTTRTARRRPGRPSDRRPAPRVGPARTGTQVHGRRPRCPRRAEPRSPPGRRRAPRERPHYPCGWLRRQRQDR